MIMISHRDRRILLLGSFGWVVLLGLTRGVPRLQARRDERAASVARLRERRDFARNAARLLPSLRDTLVVRRARLVALNAHTIAAPTASAAAATLGALVERIADDANVRVSSLELRADTLARPLRARLTVRLTAEGDVLGLETFLLAIDRSDEPMVMRQLSVSQSDPASADDRAELLHFDVTIEGLALIRGEWVR